MMTYLANEIKMESSSLKPIDPACTALAILALPSSSDPINVTPTLVVADSMQMSTVCGAPQVDHKSHT